MKNEKEFANIRKMIKKELISGYKCKIDFNDPRFLIEIEEVLIIAAKLYKKNNQIVYEFVFDTIFIGSNSVITYEEIKMINKIIGILYNYKETIISRFKKYTVEEYDYEEAKTNYFLEHIGSAFEKTLEKTYKGCIDKNNDNIKK